MPHAFRHLIGYTGKGSCHIVFHRIFVPLQQIFTTFRMYYVKKRMEIAGCHRLNLSYQSKCSNLHGHNWIVAVFCRAESLNADGMVADFTHIKQTIHGQLDHANFNEIFDFNPTAENIAEWICSRIDGCFMVSVQESEGNTVLYVHPHASATDIAAASAL